MNPLNLFYENPDPDRWIAFDRYPRKMIRRLIRGPAPVGGHERVFVNLCHGLDLLGVPYRINDYRHAREHPREAVGIIGKPHLLDRLAWQNPILFGAATFSHPIEDPNLLQRLAVRRILVPGEWTRRMWAPFYGDRVASWPVGIDTAYWNPETGHKRDSRPAFLLYDKIRWDRAHFEISLIEPIRTILRERHLSFRAIRYGHYREMDFRRCLDTCQAMIFLCEHETQGIAYQQALACNVPILAWDREGMWQDPTFYPDRVKFGPVSSVPDWDSRCGVKFSGRENFEPQLNEFLTRFTNRDFAPRDYILEHLTLERCARLYMDHYKLVQAGTA